ncbi:MAG: phosphate ABC transporter permease subunit PstC, partial [Dolichospermum sp.]
MTNSFEERDNNSLSLNNGNIDLISIGGTNFWFDRGFTWLVYLFAGITVAILFVMTWVIFQQAQPAIGQFGLGFLWSQDWDTGNQIFGALPYIYGTLVSSAIAILLAVPVGISIALVTSEDFLPIPVKSTLAFVVELIAAIPSVIIG